MAPVGVFGSAFNPPTIAHLMLIGEARHRLSLERVLVVPTGEPYHKQTDSLPPGTMRLELARAALEDQPGVELRDLEVRRDGPSYTGDTLEELAAEFPDADFHVLMGADAALGLGSWHRLERVLELATLAVTNRGRIERERIQRVVDEAGPKSRLKFFDMPEVDVSSTLVRERVRDGAPWRHLVPSVVGRMIEEQGLYGFH